MWDLPDGNFVFRIRCVLTFVPVGLLEPGLELSCKLDPILRENRAILPKTEGTRNSPVMR